MRTITIEEHFVTESFLRATGAGDRETPPQLAELQPKLLDLGAGRIADMDKSEIDLQVLSLAAMGFDALDADTATSLAHDINDELAQAVRLHPALFGGFATLSMKDPVAAEPRSLNRTASIRPRWCLALHLNRVRRGQVSKAEEGKSSSTQFHRRGKHALSVTRDACHCSLAAGCVF